MGAAQGAAGSIIHRMFVSAQRVGASVRAVPVERILLKEQKEWKFEQVLSEFKRKKVANDSFRTKNRSLVIIAKHQSNISERFEVIFEYIEMW